MTARFHIVHPGALAAVGCVAVAAAVALGYLLFVDFSDASAWQRAAGPDGSGLGDAGAIHAQARTGRAWPEQQAARRRAASSAPQLARSTP